MELVLDSLSLWLLACIICLTLAHLFLLRQPEPATHPLLLGRQSELNKVRKPNESPAFISATTGLGGQTRQLFRQVKTVQELRKSRNAQIALGNVGRAASLDGKVAALAEVLRADPSGKAFTVRLDDAADAFASTLAAAEQPHTPPTLLSSASSIASRVSSPLITSTQELAHLKGTATTSGMAYLVDSGIALKTSPDKWTPEGWKTQRIVLEDLSQGAAAGPAQLTAGTDSKADPAESSSPFAKFVSLSTGQERTALISHKNIVDGGVVSILSMFPVHERPKENDRILSFENVLTPYGASVALAGAAVGATLRLCSPAKGITSKCRAFPPDIIFCTPNELNAFRASLRNIMPSESLVVPFALARKRALLRSGNVSWTTFWDRTIFAKVRSGVVGDRLRCIVCSAEEGSGPSNEVLEYLRLVLGVPIIVALTHPFVAGPITNTMYSDFQTFPSASSSLAPADLAQLGAPSATVECKLLGADEEAVKAGSYRGELAVKGPSVAQSLEPAGSDIKTKDGWIRTGITVELQTNGTIRAVKPL